MKKLILIAGLLFCSNGWVNDVSEQKLKEEYANKISNFVFYKATIDFTQSLFPIINVYLKHDLSMPLHSINKTRINLPLDFLEELQLGFLSRVDNHSGLLTSQSSLFKEELIATFNEDEVKGLYRSLPKTAVRFSRDGYKLDPVRKNKKFVEIVDQYRFSEDFYKKFNSTASTSIFIEDFYSFMMVTFEKHGYGLDYEYDTDQYITSKDILGEWKIISETNQWETAQVKQTQSGNFMIAVKGNPMFEFNSNFKNCAAIINQKMTRCNVELVTDSMLDIEDPQGMYVLRRNDYSSLPVCMLEEQKKKCVGVTNWRSKGDRYLGDYKRVSSSKGMVQFGKSYYVYDGFGTAIYGNGAKYVGEWSDHNRHGKGTFSSYTGLKYEGRFQNNMRHGKGIQTTASGEITSGVWRNDQLHGTVEFTNVHGNVIVCDYNKGYEVSCDF